NELGLGQNHGLLVGPLCGSKGECCTHCARIRIAVLGARNAPKTDTVTSQGLCRISGAEPLTDYTPCAVLSAAACRCSRTDFHCTPGKRRSVVAVEMTEALPRRAASRDPRSSKSPSTSPGRRCGTEGRLCPDSSASPAPAQAWRARRAAGRFRFPGGRL